MGWRRKGRTRDKKTRPHSDASGERMIDQAGNVQTCEVGSSRAYSARLWIGFRALGTEDMYAETRELRRAAGRKRKHYSLDLEAASRFMRQQDDLGYGIIALHEAKVKAQFAHVWDENEVCMLCGGDSKTGDVNASRPTCGWLLQSVN